MAFHITNSYLQGVYEDVCRKNSHEPEFLQAVGEVLESLQPVAEQRPDIVKSGVIDRIVEPERSLLFRISGWMTTARSRSTGATGCSSPPPSAPPRAACGSTPA